MKNLKQHSYGIYELLTNTDVSYMIEKNQDGKYDVTMLENDEAVDDKGEFYDVVAAVEHLKHHFI